MPQAGFAHRPVAHGCHGLVAAAHPAAVLGGLDVLRAGGSAADAAVTVNAILAVVQPHMCGVGGDFFGLVFDPASGTVACLDGAGRSGMAADAAPLRAAGLAALPATGALTVTVPGCADAWAALLRRYGRRTLAQCLEPAIGLAAEGFPISDLLAQSIRERSAVIEDPEWHRIYVPAGRHPPAGARLRQPDLARTLAALASTGPAALYQGALAARIAGAVQAGGGFLTPADLAAHAGRWVPPLATGYRGALVHQTPPPTQGVTVLQALNLVEGFGCEAGAAESAARLHVLAEAFKLAYADRDRYLGDPDHVRVPVAALLDKGYAERRRGLIDPRRAMPAATAGDLAGDTTGFVVATGDGAVVVGIQSLYAAFGSGVVPPATGIVLHNRGAAFSLDPRSPTVLAPGRRPLHTLVATIVERDGAAIAGLATMGGHAQPQTHVQVLTRMLDGGQDPQEAIERPRLVQGRMRQDDPVDRLRIEQGVPARALAGLRRRGHVVEVVPERSWIMGHAQAVRLGRAGGDVLLAGGADPRGDGIALGY